MPILDPSARLKSLQNDYGTTRGPNSPAAYTLHLYVGDPEMGGTEMPTTTTLEDDTVVANGYVAPMVQSNSFAPDDIGMTATVPLPDALAEWPDAATHWLLRDATTGEGWDYAPLSEPLSVTAAGPVQPLDVTVFYDDDITL